MRKFLTALGMAALLSVSFWGMAQAAAVPQVTVVENTVANGMDAAGELTGTIIADPFETLHIFTNGTYAVAARFELQREIGSPGSGAFEKVLRLDVATANASAHNIWVNGPNRASYRVFMTVPGATGDVLANISNASSTPNDFTDFRLYLRFFDDFNTQTTTVDAGHYLATVEVGGSLAVVLVTVEEGGLTQITDTGSDGADSATVCSITVTDKAGLVSDGWMVFETRVRHNEVGSDLEMGAGFVDTVCAGASTDIPATGSSAALTVVGYTDVAVILQDGDMTNTTNFTPFAVNNGDEGNSTGVATATSLFYDTGVTIVDDEYDILRIEIDASGDVMYYINNALVFVEPTGVATSATLVPQVWVNSADGGGTTNTQIIDWWLHVITRPSDAT